MFNMINWDFIKYGTKTMFPYYILRNVFVYNERKICQVGNDESIISVCMFCFIICRFGVFQYFLKHNLNKVLQTLS